MPPSVRMAVGALAAKRGRSGAEPKQAVGVRADAPLSVAMAAQRPRPRGRGVESDALAERRAALDVAIVLVMRDSLLRVSECAALRWTDVALNPDESATAVVHRRKTKSTTTALLRAGDRGCAARCEGRRRAARDPALSAPDRAALQGRWRRWCHQPRRSRRHGAGLDRSWHRASRLDDGGRVDAAKASGALHPSPSRRGRPRGAVLQGEGLMPVGATSSSRSARS